MVGVYRLSKKGLRWFQKGHPWIFRDDLEEIEAPDRDLLARLVDPSGKPLAWASYSPHSKITLRILERGPGDGPAELRSWIAERVRQAVEARRPLARETNGCRLVSSEGDALPGLIVDRFADVLVVQFMTPFIQGLATTIVPTLVELLEPRMILARNNAKVRRLEGLPLEITLLHGTRVEKVWFEENGLSFPVDPFLGQKTGFFLDQRPARGRVRALASAGGEILDLCTYSGGFALNAAKGGAESVLAVDVSKSSLDLLEEARLANELSGVERVEANAFSFLKDLLEEGRRFDGIILDPPAFARSKREVEGAKRGYTKLNRRCLQLLRPGGWLLTCSCSYHATPSLFRNLLGEAARGMRVQDLGRIPPPEDHRVLLGFPESDYLKVHLLKKLDGAQPG
ncbi:MAG TPA: class I SAM-dependent rRNA methyltransferase [Planctomycetes bacterium]|nr:class I SAM-dependent rRNA methyltransferase [Planctomycetota bacterium]